MTVILCAIFMTIEVVDGIKVNSLDILTDAAHLFSDFATFAISLFSLWAATGWEAIPRHALVSIQLIWLLAGIMLYEAIDKIIVGPKSVDGFLMFLVSAFGPVVNIIMALLLGHDHGHGHDGHVMDTDTNMDMAIGMDLQFLPIMMQNMQKMSTIMITKSLLNLFLMNKKRSNGT
ncbi:hypothetical protein V8G54_008608 [Vigna mungo]|uniref:Cation efflux protein transmembrane domain-containing protein n=1 Tax=Vigna mungo TaxID=3915 RepID=A0AAQ3SA20_VIGMU